MTAGDRTDADRASVRSRVRGWSDRRRVTVAVGLIVLVGLALRLVALGDRVAHWDEGRVAYWALRYMQSGVYEYRPITHGPFLHVVNGDVFLPLLGPSDVSARLVVALAGAALPAGALLFRRHLRPVETVGMALALAFTPVLLYYSRFMRNDLLLAAFMLCAAGLFLRAAETRRVRYLYVGSFLVGLGFTMKENAIVYVIVWIGAAVLVADHALYRSDSAGGLDRVLGAVAGMRARYRADPRETSSSAITYAAHCVGALAVFVFVVFYFYKPRGPEQIGFLEALSQPTKLPGALDDGLLDQLEQVLYRWVERSNGEDTLSGHYVVPLRGMIETILGGAAGLFGLAVVGFVRERYRPNTRKLVMFASYWGFVSILGYPLAASVQYPAWLTVHALVPLSIPAAVGLGWIVAEAVEAYRTHDRLVLGIFGLVLVLLAGNVAVTATSTVYQHPQSHDNPMVQYAQPASPELRGAIEDVQHLSEANDGLDVLYYGELFSMDDETDAELPTVNGSGWFARLPLPWYTHSVDATTASVETEAELDEALDGDPPVVVAEADQRATLDDRLGDYRSAEYDLFRPGYRTIVIYVDESRL